MVYTDVLFRTYFIKAEQYGTAFVVNIDGDQYLVSAKHLFGSSTDDLRIAVSQNGKWRSIQLELVGAGRGDVDVIVFKCPMDLWMLEYQLETVRGGFELGQEMFFLGFPYKLAGDLGDFLDGFPSPYVKRGSLSMFDPQGHVCYLDAINNEGFSGGPLVFYPRQQPKRMLVAGVVSRFRVETEKVLDKEGHDTGMTVQYNTGIMVAYGMRHVQEIVARYSGR